MSTPELTFDQRLSRLEAIVSELENEKIELETAIERYQEGVLHLKSCRALLDGYRRRVDELAAGADGGCSPYAGDPDASAEKSSP